MKLSTLLYKRRWPEAIERIASHPKEVKPWESGYLPIHFACSTDNVPVGVIAALIGAYPQSVKEGAEPTARVPLHCAVTHTNTNIIQLLLQSHSDGASVLDYCGRTPLCSHMFTARSPSLEIVKMIVKACPDVVRISDSYDRVPLHYAARCGNLSIAQFLIDMYPDAVLKRNKYGKTPRDIAHDNDDLRLCNVLYDEEEKLLEKMKASSAESMEEEVGGDMDSTVEAAKEFNGIKKQECGGSTEEVGYMDSTVDPANVSDLHSEHDTLSPTNETDQINPQLDAANDSNLDGEQEITSNHTHNAEDLSVNDAASLTSDQKTTSEHTHNSEDLSVDSAASLTSDHETTSEHTHGAEDLSVDNVASLTSDIETSDIEMSFTSDD